MNSRSSGSTHTPPSISNATKARDDSNTTKRSSKSPPDIRFVNDISHASPDALERRRAQYRRKQDALREREAQRQQIYSAQESCKQSEQSSSSSSPESYRSNESGVGQYQLAGRLNQFEMQECKATEHLPLFTCLQLHNSVDMPQFDDLGRTINSNFSKAAEANARVLGINMAAIRDMTLMKSLWTGREDIPVSLKPANIQYRVVHDPVIDTIPHPQLRQNILRSLAMAQLDEASISRSLRTSGALVEVQGEKKRCGLVVWGRPEDMENWELTEAFMFQFGHLLNGCEDLIAATNRWRSQRGEPPLSSHQAIWNDMIRDIA